MFPTDQDQQPAFPQAFPSQQSPYHTKENAPPLSERRSESSKQRMTLQARLDSLNAELRYSNFGELRVCLCEASTLDSTSDVIHNILAQLQRQLKRVKLLQQDYGEERTSRQLREKEKNQLSYERDNLTRERDSLQEKLKAQAREQKEREEKWAKERQGFAKDRRGWMQREDAVRNHARNMQDKAKQLQDKLKKMLQKGDKTEFRNASFEILVPLSQSQRSMIHREYQHGIAKSIEHHTRTLEEENHGLRELMKEIFARLQRVAHLIDPEGTTEQHRPEIIDLPSPPRGRTYPDILRRFLNSIEERTSQLKTPAVHGGNNLPSDTGELMQTVSVLKGFYTNWEAVNESRKKIVPGLLQVAAERGRLAKLSQLVDQEVTDQSEEHEVEAEDYVTQKMEYFKREINRVNRWTSNIESLQSQVLI